MQWDALRRERRADEAATAFMPREKRPRDELRQETKQRSFQRLAGLYAIGKTLLVKTGGKA
jgi:hypothetical protein